MKFALAQMLVEGGRPERNLARAAERIASAAERGAQLVLLPEALDFGWMHPSARDGAGPIPGGESCRALAEAARRNGVFVCSGIVERDGGRLFNAAVLIGPGGELLAQHRKINELEIAHEIYAVGTEVEAVADTTAGRLGVHICADAFAENQWISRALAARGARVILSPCAWAVDEDCDPDKTPYGELWRENYGPVARECGVWIAGCSNVGRIEAGPWAGHPCIGNSIVFDASGREVMTGPYGEGADEILFVEVA